jgi:hypothetical protein
MATGDQFGNLIQGTGINLARVGSGIRISADIASLTSGSGATVTALDSSGNYSLDAPTAAATAAVTTGAGRNTTSNTAGQGLTVNAGGATSGSTDKNGGDLTLKGGVATGTGTSNVRLQACPAGSTGTSDGTVVDRLVATGTGIEVSGSIKVTRTATAITYTALTTDYLIAVTSTASARTINLPTAASMTGRVYVIKDESGAAGTNNITIDGNASETIDGATTLVISSNYGTATIYSNGTAWFTI